MAFCSTSLLTGPRRVTLPSRVMILMFLAVVERSSRPIIALRTLRLISRSESDAPWSVAVRPPSERSRALTPVLSGFCADDWLVSAGYTRLLVSRPVGVSRLVGICSARGGVLISWFDGAVLLEWRLQP